MDNKKLQEIISTLSEEEGTWANIPKCRTLLAE